MSEDSIVQYLTQNPDFFADKDELLMSMVIPHASGKAISLLERQVNLLRERNNENKDNINQIIANAKANDELFEKIRKIILELLATTNLEDLAALIKKKLKNDFSASESKLVFIAEGSPQLEQQTVLPLSQIKDVLGELFSKQRSFCGSLASKQITLLFPDANPAIASAALIPLHLNKGIEANRALGIPLLIIGSTKENQFHSNLDTLFLDFIGEVLAAHISNMARINVI